MLTEPLTQTELDTYTEYAERTVSVEAPFPFRVIPYTGLTMGEFLHLRPSWIEWGTGDALSRNDAVVIEIPPEAECRHHVWAPSSPHSEERVGECQYCQNMEYKDGFWRPRGEGAVRQIPVFQTVAQQALHRWFKTIGRESVPFTQPGLYRLFKRLNTVTPVDKELSYLALRYTFIRICGEQGLSKDQIEKINPFYRIRKEVREILQNTSTDYNFEYPPGEKIEVIKNHQPITAKQLAESTGNTADTELNFLQNGVRLGFLVEESRRFIDGGRPKIHFELADGVEPNGAVPCPETGCERSFPQLNALSRHLSSAHN